MGDAAIGLGGAALAANLPAEAQGQRVVSNSRNELRSAAASFSFVMHGGAGTITLDDALLASPGRGANFVALDDALQDLARLDARKSQVVELRFFGGLSVAETAETLGISPETVMRDWRFAKVWLLRQVSGRD